MRGTKRYTVQTLKKKEKVDDPYAMSKHTPKGVGICQGCHAVYHNKRWSLPKRSTKSSSPRSDRSLKGAGNPVVIPQQLTCPACQKLRDGYAEGFVSLHWPNWPMHKAEILGLVHNEEKRACQINPLERIMTIRTRPDGADIETTTGTMAQRLGKHLQNAFKGSITYKWSHKDKLARIDWTGPRQRRASRKK